MFPAAQLPKTQIQNWRQSDFDSLPEDDTLLLEADLGLVDMAENENDVSLWLDLLSAANRQHGRNGVLAIWDAAERRKALYDVNSEGAEIFWKTILDAVVDDESRLQRVVLHAEWMLRSRSVQLPFLYSTTISYCLRNGQHRRAMQWHVRLMPNFDPGSEAFGNLLQQFVSNPDTDLQETLKCLYIATLHHNLYDKIIPFLYERGRSRLCAYWRELLIRFHDLPQPTPESQPYLRFLSRYYPGTPLELEEQLVFDLNSPAYWDLKHDSLWDAMSGIHGEGNGLAGRRYSDTLGARWFASSWVPLDFAIHAVHALGVRQIGPLSLQSISLREPTPSAVMARIDQLHKVNIGIGHSTYARAVKHFAENAEHDLLSELLHTDIHPEVFDDPTMQQRIRDEALESGAWKRYRLLLAIHPAIAGESIESTSNILFQQRLEQRQTRQALALMDDMRSMNVKLSAASVQLICSNILEPLAWNPKVGPLNWESLQTAISYLKRLLLLQKPVPSRYWRKILFSLGKFGRFDELEDLCLGIIDTYQALSESQGGLLPVHPTDVPPSSMGALTEKVVIPVDLPTTHDHHPLRRIFSNPALHVAIVRWGFKAGLSKDLAQWALGVQEVPVLAIIRGVRLLAKMEKHGIPLETSVVRAEVIRCLTQLYEPQSKKAALTRPGLPDLVIIKDQINKAFGQATDRPLLPDIIALRDALMARVDRRHRRSKN
nr:pentatricopeptide repeat domain-containing protein [Colletotrichum truncatum]KAF6791615.1 pentatricopeptide repeat domain-containing protein [Colletotrichum truncatum]